MRPILLGINAQNEAWVEPTPGPWPT